MAYQNHVTVGPEFFRNAVHDYADWAWAIIREFVQNGVDCGSKNMRITVSNVGNDTQLVVENDGAPMSEDTLVHKLLSLGSSGKTGQDMIGGFGKAKEILYFAHERYSIETGDLVVNGAGAGYDLARTDTPLSGTRSTVLISGPHVALLCATARRLASYMQWGGQLYLNGSRLPTDLYKGSRRRELPFGVLYTNRSYSELLVVRSHGVPMYAVYADTPRCVVLELVGSPMETLTANRDGLRYAYQQAVNGILLQLSTNSHRALRDPPKIERLVHPGGKLRVASQRKEPETTETTVYTWTAKTAYDRSEVRICRDAEVSATTVQDTDAVQLIVRNETGLRTPAGYRPETGLSRYAYKLAVQWGRLLLELHHLHGMSAEFSIGFLFDPDYEALHSLQDGETVYYLNPVTIDSAGDRRRFRRRFSRDDSSRLLSIAAHEFVHGLGFASHNEEYANKFTDVFAQVVKRRHRFAHCFRVPDRPSRRLTYEDFVSPRHQQSSAIRPLHVEQPS